MPSTPSAAVMAKRLKRIPKPTMVVEKYQAPAVDRRSKPIPIHLDAHGLRLWRRLRYLSMTDLAAVLGVSSWITIQRWELGHNEPPPYLELALERLDELMLWHPDGARLKDNQSFTLDIAPPKLRRHRAPAHDADVG